MTALADPHATGPGVASTGDARRPEYRPQMPDGSMGPRVVTGWDVRTNRRL
jgi:hypothetical protein